MQLRDCYGDVTTGNISTESNVIKANSDFLAVPWAQAGTVCVNPLNRNGAIPEDTPLIYNINNDGERAPINEFNFAPHDNSLLAIAGQDGSAGFYRIPVGGLTEDIKDSELRIQASDKRLLSIDWHPLASGVVFTSAADKTVAFWDVEAGGSKTFQLPDVHKGLLTGTSWNLDGSQLATCAKDKTLRVFGRLAPSVKYA